MLVKSIAGVMAMHDAVHNKVVPVASISSRAGALVIALHSSEPIAMMEEYIDYKKLLKAGTSSLITRAWASALPHRSHPNLLWIRLIVWI